MTETRNKKIIILQIISIAIVLLFVVLSAFDCIHVCERSTLPSQMAKAKAAESVDEPTEYTSTYNNQLVRVAAVGAVEIILIIVSCFKLNIVAASIELFLTVGTIGKGYLEGLFETIGCSRSIVTFEITPIGYGVLLLAMINLVLAITLQHKKESLSQKK